MAKALVLLLLSVLSFSAFGNSKIKTWRDRIVLVEPVGTEGEQFLDVFKEEISEELHSQAPSIQHVPFLGVCLKQKEVCKKCQSTLPPF